MSLCFHFLCLLNKSFVLLAFVLFLNKKLEYDTNQTYCPGGLDYSPCFCTEENFLSCDGIPLNSIAQLFEKMNSTNEIENFELILQYSDQLIPANLLADHRVKNEMKLKCKNVFTQKLKIDRDVFNASRNYTDGAFLIDSCDLTGLDFFFLEGFDQLNELAFKRIANFHMANWYTLPHLPGLKVLNIYCAMGLNEWSQFPVLLNGLYEISLTFDAINDDAINRILQWLLDSPTANTLKELDIQRNALTEVPRMISYFKTLTNVYMAFNDLSSTLKSGSFKLATAVSSIELFWTGIEKIDPGAFQGW